MNKFLTTELIGKSSRLITNNLAQRILQVKIGITTEQWIILQILSINEKTQKELSEITLKNKASVNSLISNLLKLGYINKSISNIDKRETIISLTKKGEETRKNVAKEAAISVNNVLEGFSTNEINTLNSLLKRINNNLINKK